MDDKNNVLLVGMSKAEISSEEQPIIGTVALATCVGLILYSEEHKKAIVAHVAPGQTDIISQIVDLIIQNDLVETKMKYKIIPGYYQEHYGTRAYLEKNFKCYIPFDDKEMGPDAIEINEEFTSKQFAFDARTGKFVTKQIDFDQVITNIKSKRR